ncbi:DUF3352 domain-containing protein [Nonomuraea sp. NPDC050556]|uniref:DUF3352 domain-containing protein n=1 Tax=Nonomuraea sp. NPDC050556 TaxID=3364369 RepID=UPI00378CEFAF
MPLSVGSAQPYPPQQQPAYGAQPPYGQQPGWQLQGPEGFGPPVVAEKKRKGWIVAVIAALAVVLLGGGTVYAVSAFSGGGTQPHEVLPSNAIGYLRVDLDPDAGQKAALFQLSRKFTFSKGKVTEEDPRKSLFDATQADRDNKIDFAKDVEPWLGSRIGAAAVPSGGETPGFAVAVQVKDEALAKAGIAKLMGDEKYGLAFREGYAILSDTQANADKYATGPTMSENAEFTGDIDSLAGDGVLSFWGHLGQLAKLSAAELGPEEQAQLDKVKNARFVGTLRFDSAFAELTGSVRGAEKMVDGDLAKADLATLPGSTVGAMSISGLDQVVTKQWAEFEKTMASMPEVKQFMDQAKQNMGLTLPDDLVTLVGKNLTLAVDEEGLDGDMPKGGVRIQTDAAKAQAVLDKITKAFQDSGQPVPEFGKVAGDGVFTVGTTEDYAKKLSQQGNLGDSETFKTAIPNAGDANYALFVDLDKVEKFYLGSVEGDDKANLEVLRAVGLSGTQSADSASFSLRVLFN